MTVIFGYQLEKEGFIATDLKVRTAGSERGQLTEKLEKLQHENFYLAYFGTTTLGEHHALYNIPKKAFLTDDPHPWHFLFQVSCIEILAVDVETAQLYTAKYSPFEGGNLLQPLAPKKYFFVSPCRLDKNNWLSHFFENEWAHLVAQNEINHDEVLNTMEQLILSVNNAVPEACEGVATYSITPNNVMLHTHA